MRKRLFGYSSSLERKKQYLQSRLQMAPVGLVSTWNWLGAVVTLIVDSLGKEELHLEAELPVRPEARPLGVVVGGELRVPCCPGSGIVGCHGPRSQPPPSLTT